MDKYAELGGVLELREAGLAIGGSFGELGDGGEIDDLLLVRLGGEREGGAQGERGEGERTRERGGGRGGIRG